MGGYILRRLFLVIPTLFGIMLINFALTQFVPGGPFDQIEARLEGGGDAIEAVTGAGGGDPGATEDSGYVGARGLPPEFRAKLEVEFGFARFICPEGFEGSLTEQAKACEKEMIPAWERFTIMMGKFLRFDFGESYFRSASVTDLIIESREVDAIKDIKIRIMPSRVQKLERVAPDVMVIYPALLRRVATHIVLFNTVLNQPELPVCYRDGVYHNGHNVVWPDPE